MAATSLSLMTALLVAQTALPSTADRTAPALAQPVPPVALCQTLLDAPERSLREAQPPRVHVELEAQRDSKIKRGLAVARVAAPAEVVYRIVTDYDRFDEFFPLVRESRLETESEDVSVVFQLIDLPFPITNRHYRIEVVNDWGMTRRGRRCFESRWQYEHGSGNIEQTYGRWEVMEDGEEHSLVAYLAFIDPGGKIPTWTYNWSTKQALPRMMRALRAEASRRLPSPSD